jgi:hypothetical protein
VGTPADYTKIEHFQTKSKVAVSVSARNYAINVNKDHNKKKKPMFQAGGFEKRSLTFFMINQISKGPTPGRPIGRLGVGHPSGRIWRFQLLSINNVLNE